MFLRTDQCALARMAHREDSLANLVIEREEAEDGIRDRSPSRGLGDVYKRQVVAQEGSWVIGIVHASQSV